MVGVVLDDTAHRAVWKLDPRIVARQPCRAGQRPFVAAGRPFVGSKQTAERTGLSA